MRDPEKFYLAVMALVDVLYEEDVREVHIDNTDPLRPVINVRLAPDVSHINIAFTIDVSDARTDDH